MARPNERNIGRWDSLHLEAACSQLAPFLSRAVDQVYTPLQRQDGASVAYDQVRMIQDLRMNHPRICPACLAEGGYLHQHWGLAIIAHCQHHKSLLLDHCPQCTKPFVWKTSLFEGCSHCGMTWDECMHSQVAVSPLEQQVTSHLETDKADRDLIKDICAVIVIAARPFDSMHQSVGSVGYMNGYSSLVARAYRLLESKEAQRHWHQACLLERHYVEVLGDAAVLRPILNLKKSLSRPLDVDRVGVAEPSLFAHEDWTLNGGGSFIKPYRLRAFANDAAALRYQVTLHELAMTLDVPSSDIQALVDSGAITPTNTTTVLRDQLFDLRSLAASVSELPSMDAIRKNSNNYIRVTIGSEIFRRYMTSYGVLLGAVLSGGIQGYVDSNASLSSLYIETTELETWLNQRLTEACSEPVASDRAARALGCSDKRLRAMVKNGELSWARWSQNGERVDGESLRELLQQKTDTFVGCMEGESNA